MGNLYLTKNQYGRNEICCVEDYHKYMSNMREKEFSCSDFDSEGIGKISIFQEISPNFIYFHKIRNCSSIIVIFLEQLLLPYNFHGSSIERILFFIFYFFF